MAFALRLFLCIILIIPSFFSIVISESICRPFVYMINFVRYSKACLRLYLILMFPILYFILFMICFFMSPLVFLFQQVRFLRCCSCECCDSCCNWVKSKINKDDEIEKDVRNLFIFTEKHCVYYIIGDDSNVYDLAVLCGEKRINVENKNFVKFSMVLLLFPIIGLFIIFVEVIYRPIWIIKEVYKIYKGCIRYIMIITFPILYLFIGILVLISSIYCFFYNISAFYKEDDLNEAILSLLFYKGGHCINTCCGVPSVDIYKYLRKEKKEKTNSPVKSKPEVNNIDNTIPTVIFIDNKSSDKILHELKNKA